MHPAVSAGDCVLLSETGRGKSVIGAIIYLRFSGLPIEQGFLLLRGDGVELPQCEAVLHSISWSLRFK